MSIQGRIRLTALILFSLVATAAPAQVVLDLGVDSGGQVVRYGDLVAKTQSTLLLSATPGLRFGDSLRVDVPLRIVATGWSSAAQGFIYNAYWGTSTGIRLGMYYPSPEPFPPFIDALFGSVALHGNWIHYRTTWLISFFPSIAATLEAVHRIGTSGFYVSAGPSVETHLRKDMNLSVAGSVTLCFGFDLMERER